MSTLNIGLSEELAKLPKSQAVTVEQLEKLVGVVNTNAELYVNEMNALKKRVSLVEQSIHGLINIQHEKNVLDSSVCDEINCIKNSMRLIGFRF